MDINRHQALINLAKDYLEVTICVDLDTRMPNGTEFAESFAKLINVARVYYMDAALERDLISSRSDKEALAIFDSAVDDYIFGKILESISRIRSEPVKSPMELISVGIKINS